jgi:hypothetical protein
MKLAKVSFALMFGGQLTMAMSLLGHELPRHSTGSAAEIHPKAATPILSMRH